MFMDRAFGIDAEKCGPITASFLINRSIEQQMQSGRRADPADPMWRELTKQWQTDLEAETGRSWEKEFAGYQQNVAQSADV